MAVKPLVGVLACRKRIDPHPFHCVAEKYLLALHVLSGALPVAVPSLGQHLEVDAWLEHLNGVLLPGSPSNIETHHYGHTAPGPGPVDQARDATSLHLIRRCFELGVPVLAICRGCQEVNVALGGSLHPELHRVPGRTDHREDTTLALEQQYGPRHSIEICRDGMLRRIYAARTAEVNSLHGQGIDRVAPCLQVEAVAEDGTIEALHCPTAPAFNLALQWHPEWQAADNALSRSIFRAFGAACQKHSVKNQ